MDIDMSILRALERDKEISLDIVVDALEQALLTAYHKTPGAQPQARVAIDRKSGDYETFRRWKVFADDSKELEVPERELRLDDALEMDSKAEIGGFVEEPVESVAFGRIAAQQAKQTAAEAKATYDQLTTAEQALQAALAAAGRAGAAEFAIDERGLVVHVVSDPVLFAPESAALLRSGDIVEVDVPARSISMRVAEEELARRRAAWTPPPPRFERGYGFAFTKHIQQADKGCDFDFLRTDFGAPVPEPVIY